MLRVAGAAPAETLANPNLYADEDDDEFVPASDKDNFDAFDWQLCKVREDAPSIRVLTLHIRRRPSLCLHYCPLIHPPPPYFTFYLPSSHFPSPFPHPLYLLLVSSYSVHPFSSSLLLLYPYLSPALSIKSLPLLVSLILHVLLLLFALSFSSFFTLYTCKYINKIHIFTPIQRTGKIRALYI